MEAAALNQPPLWLERIVLLAIPPAAREAMAGDLWETYRSPRQYAAEALRTVPFVIASQMRRNINLPVLMLQAALAFVCAGGPATLLLLPALMLRCAYQATERPCPRRVFREAMLLSSGVTLLLLQIMTMRFPAAATSGLDHFAWLSLFLQALLLSPLLCLFHTGLIMQGDRRPPDPAEELPRQDLAHHYQDFVLGAHRHNLLEAAVLAFAATCGFFLVWNAVLVGLYALVAVYLLWDATPHALPAKSDFVSLRSCYQRELTRQQQLRRFLRWLWLAPALVALHAKVIEGSLASGRPVTAVLGCIAAVILCFLVAALNREHGGRVQEQIGLLDRMREKMIPKMG